MSRTSLVGAAFITAGLTLGFVACSVTPAAQVSSFGYDVPMIVGMTQPRPQTIVQQPCAGFVLAAGTLTAPPEGWASGQLQVGHLRLGMPTRGIYLLVARQHKDRPVKVLIVPWPDARAASAHEVEE